LIAALHLLSILSAGVILLWLGVAAWRTLRDRDNGAGS
jgi:hypothetical protein